MSERYGIAYVYPNKPARYEVRRARDKRPINWTADLSWAYTRAATLNEKEHHTVFDHLGEDGIFERDVKNHLAHGGTIKRPDPQP